MRAYERLLNYVKVYTTSDEESETCPSAKRELDLARILVDELKELGVTNAECDSNGYVYASLPASEGCEDAPKIGFIAHMDTAPDFSGENVNPLVHDNYNGEDVELIGRTIKTSDFPHLKDLKGKTLITSDGTTLLGADDKSGVSEIMTMIEEISKSDIKHGKILIGFTPDEEIGRGADLFNVEKFGADFAYTVDGGEENAIEFENFNAASCEVEIEGESIHPGDAKDKMINASLVAMDFNSRLPQNETPRDTEGYEGFFHLTDMEGDVSNAKLSYIIRDHDANKFAERCERAKQIEKEINEKWNKEICKVTVKEQYRNMKEKIEPVMFVVERAEKAIKDAGLDPKFVAIRGGTDGARLSFMGLPCPNLGTGGYAFHGPYEHITAEAMDKMVEILINIVRI